MRHWSLRITDMKHTKMKGMTLIELIIVIVIISILFTVGAMFLTSTFTAYFNGKNLIDVDTQARVALNRITNDLHNLRSPADITSANANSLAFTDLYGNAITYQVSGPQLQRNNLVLATKTQSITFQYYDQSGNVLTTPVTGANILLIQYIKVSLVLGNYTYPMGVTLWNNI